jgi:hypothetical protein
MDGFVVHEITPAVRVRVVRAMPALPADLEARVEALWRTAAARVATGGAGRLFNGRVFSADHITGHEISGHMTEFRRIVAQMEAPELFEALGLRPPAVCGVVHGPDGVAIGRRPAAAVYQPGLWQLPPAGSVDADALLANGTLDLRAQALTEFAEELGLSTWDVEATRPLCIVEHPGSHVADLGMAMPTRLGRGAILAAHRARGNTEYAPLLVVSAEALPRFLAEAGNAMVPPGRVFLSRAGLLP